MEVEGTLYSNVVDITVISTTLPYNAVAHMHVRYYSTASYMVGLLETQACQVRSNTNAVRVMSMKKPFDSTCTQPKSRATTPSIRHMQAVTQPESRATTPSIWHMHAVTQPERRATTPSIRHIPLKKNQACASFYLLFLMHIISFFQFEQT